MAHPTLKERVIDHIRLRGPMTARAFIDWALYDPQEGYYMKDHQVFGRRGDFYTAPQIHGVYGSTLARWLVERARRLGWQELHVVEFGAGTGQLAEQVLSFLVHVPIGVRYSIVEVSPAWRRRQAERLAKWGTSVSWPEEMPFLERAVVIAHEFLDALPVHVMRRTRDGVEEAWVDVDKEGRLVCRWGSPSPEGWRAYDQK
ncbi:MAG: SAM-dependent methyltransferase, partial [Alicyclobacillaceae bacterium]|nr:SAM-dependent methyltransferase [Alicyclobacillaceae bacterium]